MGSPFRALAFVFDKGQCPCSGQPNKQLVVWLSAAPREAINFCGNWHCRPARRRWLSSFTGNQHRCPARRRCTFQPQKKTTFSFVIGFQYHFHCKTVKIHFSAQRKQSFLWVTVHFWYHFHCKTVKFTFWHFPPQKETLFLFVIGFQYHFHCKTVKIHFWKLKIHFLSFQLDILFINPRTTIGSHSDNSLHQGLLQNPVELFYTESFTEPRALLQQRLYRTWDPFTVTLYRTQYLFSEMNISHF